MAAIVSGSKTKMAAIVSGSKTKMAAIVSGSKTKMSAFVSGSKCGSKKLFWGHAPMSTLHRDKQDGHLGFIFQVLL
ncbi:MAG: hypothetical protein ACRCUD_00610 [Cetobacterium sp.]